MIPEADREIKKSPIAIQKNMAVPAIDADDSIEQKETLKMNIKQLFQLSTQNEKLQSPDKSRRPSIEKQQRPFIASPFE